MSEPRLPNRRAFLGALAGVPAVAAFSDSTLPTIGIERIRSAFFRKSGETPSPSLPTISASGSGKSACWMSSASSPASSAAAHQPRALSAFRALRRFGTTATGMVSTAPADALTTAGVTSAARFSGMTMPDAPAAAAVLISVPKFCGSWR